MTKKKQRIDLLLVEKGFFQSRQQAQRSIMAGLVLANHERIDKPGMRVLLDAMIEVKGQVHSYVSRGGLKLEKALKCFQIHLQSEVIIDVGASTGGFTDCALQHGAKCIYAIDVGYGQLAWKLRQDQRVIVMERTNFRYLKEGDLKGEQPRFAMVDVSFISLSIIFPVINRLLPEQGQVITLIKPQFEAGKEQVEKHGLVKDAVIHEQVLTAHVQLAYREGFDVQGIIFSPIQGKEGNIEYLSYCIKRETKPRENWKTEIENIVKLAHQMFK